MGAPPNDVPSWPAGEVDPQAAAAAMNTDALQGALGARMGIEFLHVGPDRVVARMPVAGNTQPYGLLHGGASVVLAESVGSVAAAVHAGPGQFPVGIEINATHHRSARSGYVTATATPLSTGRTLSSFQIGVLDDQGRPVCTARLTCIIRNAS
ncbi:MAG: PaaI family thioesterase [Candidatus Nanopelagicales bacterium]